MMKHSKSSNTINFELFEEPQLQFSDYFQHEDTKTGLAEYGPFGKNVPGLHASEIKLGFVGDGNSISSAKEWIDKCSKYIESENIKVIKSKKSDISLFKDEFDFNDPTLHRLNKILNRDFVGFNKDTTFNSCFLQNPRWDRIIHHRNLSQILQISDKRKRIAELIELFISNIESITQTDPIPDIIIVCLNNEIAEKGDTIQISGNFHLNFRRALKAKVMNLKNPTPIQILKQRTVEGKRDVQETATRAWNFCTALYYKANGVPWIPANLEKDTCYIGVSFYVSRDLEEKQTIRSSIAQAFDFLGQGLILRGEAFEWNTKDYGTSPHLTKSNASKLIETTLKKYAEIRGNYPNRVVIHKSSEFWGESRNQYNEIDGFYEGIDKCCSNCSTDFVTIRQTGLRLFREGLYPPLRGTYFNIENSQHFLFTMGFIPYLETYPKPYVPEPWQLIQSIGDSSPKDLLKEILILTKMNVNNCAFADGTPITISFSRKVGEILKHISEDETVQTSYRYYM